MWLRPPEFRVSGGVLSLRGAPEGAGGTSLRAALVWWPPTASGEAATPGIRLAAAAWDAPDGQILWGWPDAEGRVAPRPTELSADECLALAPSLSLALALRRSRQELGVRCLVVGDGYPARWAAATVRTFGWRIREVSVPGSLPFPEEPRPDVVIETSGTEEGLAWSLSRCRDWGHVFSLGSGLSRRSLDYYTDVHRRAISLHRVPPRPYPLREEDPVIDRSLPLLSKALRGITLEQGDTVPVQGLPEDGFGYAVRDRCGWVRLGIRPS